MKSFIFIRGQRVGTEPVIVTDDLGTTYTHYHEGSDWVALGEVDLDKRPIITITPAGTRATVQRITHA